MTLYWLLHAQLKRHLKDKVSGLRLHKSTSTRRKPRHSSSAKPQATNGKCIIQLSRLQHH